MVLAVDGVTAEAASFNEKIYFMHKTCRQCTILLTEDNAAKKNSLYWRNECKSCRSKQSIIHSNKDPEKRRARINSWVRRVGKVKQYPCQTCKNLCYKKYALAFCSDKCRFLSHVEVKNQCWLWTGGKNGFGYGKTNKDSVEIAAHRLSYELFIGAIEKGKLVCHSCDVPPCVNPNHLWIGTTQENKQDQLKKNRGGKKLKESDVIEIRRLYESGMGSQKISYLFNVTCSTISNIIKRRIWKHIEYQGE